MICKGSLQNFVLENELFPVENGERVCVIEDEPQILQKLSLLLGTWLKFKEIVFPFNHPRIKFDWLRSVSSTYFWKLIPGQLDFPQGDFQEYCFCVEFSPGGFPRVLFLGV